MDLVGTVTREEAPWSFKDEDEIQHNRRRDSHDGAKLVRQPDLLHNA
jgi:hypothetical protein